MIKIEQYSKSYGEKQAVKDLNLQVSPGSICGFIGHNGAGKTTTLKAIAGILPITQGDIFLQGVSVKTQPLQAKQSLAYVPDSPDIYPFLTGYQFLHFIAQAYGVPRGQAEAQEARLAGLFEMGEALPQSIGGYSHGMKQKLLLMSAFLHQPTILILDEPFVGLDPKASSTLKALMRELCKAGGAILYSTHVLEVAEQLCDSLAIIQEGALLCQGKTQTLLENSSLESLFFSLNQEDSL